MTLAFVALIAGLALLVWSADKFVDGAAATASGSPSISHSSRSANQMSA